MNIEQLEQASQKSQELIKFHRQNENMKEFIKGIKEGEYLRLIGPYQSELWGSSSSSEVFGLLGNEIIELLEEKLNERSRYLSQFDVVDLIKESE